jgi:hypothetical protein
MSALPTYILDIPPKGSTFGRARFLLIFVVFITIIARLNAIITVEVANPVSLKIFKLR